MGPSEAGVGIGVVALTNIVVTHDAVPNGTEVIVVNVREDLGAIRRSGGVRGEVGGVMADSRKTELVVDILESGSKLVSGLKVACVFTGI